MNKGKCKHNGHINVRDAIEYQRLLYVPNELTNSRVTLKAYVDGCSHGYEFLKVQTISHDDTWHHILQWSIHRHYSHINGNHVERHSDLLLPHVNSL
jgi:hypothetical protein